MIRTKVLAGLFVVLLGGSIWFWFMSSLAELTQGEQAIEPSLFLLVGFVCVILYLAYSLFYFTLKVVKWVIGANESS